MSKVARLIKAWENVDPSVARIDYVPPHLRRIPQKDWRYQILYTQARHKMGLPSKYSP